MNLIKATVCMLVALSCSGCGKFNINEAAGYSHKCPSKHARRLHTYGGKLYYSSMAAKKYQGA